MTTTELTHFEAMMQQIAEKGGFIAALDQSGGSTPKGTESLRRGR